MARIDKMSELEARKRALVTESELCREALKAELENFRAYTDGFFKKIDRVRSFTPWLMLAAPVAIPLIKMFTGRKAPENHREASPMKGRLATLMLGLRLYRQYGPLVRSLVQSVAAQFTARRRAAGEARSPAANI
jgi:hypothetical protein